MEIELKIDFENEETFQKAMNLFKGERSVERQINTYFDDDDGILSKNKISVRLRQTGIKNVITIKDHPFFSNGIRKTAENECLISDAEAEEILKNPSKLLDMNPAVNHLHEVMPEKVTRLVEHGSFMTERTRIPYTFYYKKIEKKEETIKDKTNKMEENIALKDENVENEEGMKKRKKESKGKKKSEKKKEENKKDEEKEEKEYASMIDSEDIKNVDKKIDVKLEFDNITFPSYKWYQLEIESNEPNLVQMAAEAILERGGVEFKRSNLTKHKLFIQNLKLEKEQGIEGRRMTGVEIAKKNSVLSTLLILLFILSCFLFLFTYAVIKYNLSFDDILSPFKEFKRKITGKDKIKKME